jgi:site-specific recombinase XerD
VDNEEASPMTEPLALIDPPLPYAQDPFCVYTGKLAADSAESARAMRRCLGKIAALWAGSGEDEVVTGESRAWWLLRYEHTVRIRTLLMGQGWAPSTVNQHLTALRQVLKECRRLGLMSAEDFILATDIKGAKGHRESPRRTVHADERARLLAVCVGMEDPPVIGIRDAALVAFLYSTGCRREEAASALIERYDAGVRTLRVIGKGDKERTVVITPAAVPHLERWLVLLGERQGPMFRPVNKSGRIGNRHIGPRDVGRRVNIRRVEAGLVPLSTHDLRATFAGSFLDEGGDLPQLQRVMGHANVNTSAGYDHRGDAAIGLIVDRFSLPSPAELVSRKDGS